jgi:hypothetical protein
LSADLPGLPNGNGQLGIPVLRMSNDLLVFSSKLSGKSQADTSANSLEIPTPPIFNRGGLRD